MSLKLDRLEINDKKLYYKYFYYNFEDTIIFLHGFGLDYRSWLGQINPFKNRYNLLIYDQIGYGQSDDPGEEHVNAHKDLLSLMNHLNISKAHLVGLSMGGGVVLNFTIAYPDRVSSISLAGSVVDGYILREFSSLTKEIWKLRDAEKARMEWLKLDLFKYILQDTKNSEIFKQMMDDYSGWHWVNGYKVEYLDPPTYFQLDRITTPTLVLVGKDDMSDFISISEILEKEIRDANRIIMPTGHMINMEDPTGFNLELSKFLSSL